MKSFHWILLFCLMGLVGAWLLVGSSGDAVLVAHSQEEERLAQVLSRIPGAGDCEVFLFPVQQTSAFDQEQAWTAQIFCQGAEDLSVYLAVQRLVHTTAGIAIESIDIYSKE